LYPLRSDYEAMPKKLTYNFKATIRFVGFDSEADRDRCYDLWVDSQLRGAQLKSQSDAKISDHILLKISKR